MLDDAQAGHSAVIGDESDALDLLKSTLDAQPLGVGIFEPVDEGRDIRLVYVNRAFQAIKPFRPMLGRLYREVWPELAEFAVPRFLEVLKTGVPWVESELPLEVEVGQGVIETRYYTYQVSRLEAGGSAFLLDTAEEVSRQVEGRRALEESKDKYRNLFTNLIDGFALHQVVLDSEGCPVDYVFLEVNEAFEQLSGLNAEDIVGKRVTEVLPGIDKDPADWIGRYGHVAVTGQPMRFEQFSEQLRKWYEVSAYRPEDLKFVAVFDDITDRKRAEEEREQVLRELRKKDQAIRQAYSDVIDAVTGGRLILLNADELQSALVGPPGKRYEMREPSDLPESRARVASILAGTPGLHDLLLAFSEGATNMLKHAHGGTYQVREGDHRVQFVLSDKGPGIDFRNLPKATLVPGFSTQQTLGMGFTLMMELMDRLLLSTDSGGTTLVLEKGLL